MKVPRLFLLFLAILLLGGCAGREMIARMAPAPERALAEAVIADLQKGDVEALSQRSPDWLGSMPPQVGARLAARMPAEGRPVLLNFNWRVLTDGRRETRLVYGLDGAGRHAIVTVITRRIGEDQPQLVGFEVRPLDRSFETIDDFRLADGGVSGWLVLLLQIAAFSASVAAIWRVWRTDLFRRRWLWTLGCVLGIGTIQAPWPTSVLTFAPLSFQLFSVGAFFANPFGPWLLRVSVPVVAIIVLLRRRRPSAPEEPAGN